MATMTTSTSTMIPRYRFTIADYELMGQAGILNEDDRVELIEREIIVVSPIGPRHALYLYAAAGIPEAWLVDLAAGRIERHTDPGTTGYRAIIRAERGDTIASTAVPALAIAVDAVLDVRG